MNISVEKLKELTVQVAKEKFGSDNFERRPLMLAVERRVKYLGYWIPKDNEESGSAGRKSKGLAEIDWVVSTLKQEGRLVNTDHDQWRLP